MCISIKYPKRRYAACPPPRLTSHLSLVIQYPEVAQNSAKLAPTWVQKSTKTGVPHRPAVPEQSWRCLESVLGTLWGGTWAVLGSSWGVLGPSWGRLGASWTVLWASWGRLGGILCQIFSPKGVKFRHAILDTIFQSIFG